jgi:hypothetical protein
MMTHYRTAVALALGVAVGCQAMTGEGSRGAAGQGAPQAGAQPASPGQSGAGDEQMAEDLWRRLQAANYRDAWATVPGKGTFYQGQVPHGALLSTYLSPEAERGLQAKSGSMPADAIIVKENYMPDRTLAAVTVMYKEPGFDPEHGDWFWAKYGTNGEVQESGRAVGCITCHGSVQSNDYVFTFPIAPRPPS